jgi:hypothetical protein
MNTTNTRNTSSRTHRTAETAQPRALRALSSVRDDLRERRQARAEYRALERDLASYTTHAQVDDLLAAIRDEDSLEAETIRAILGRNLLRSNANHQRAS